MADFEGTEVIVLTAEEPRGVVLYVPPPRKGGRQTDYTEAMAERICERLIEGESLRQICRDPEMPGFSTIFRWLNAHPAFESKYARARELQCENKFEELEEIAADGRNDWMEVLDRHGNAVGWRINGEAVARSKLRIETAMWRLEKLRPKKFGKQQQDLSADGQAVVLLANEIRTALHKRVMAALKVEPKPDGDSGPGG